MVNDKNNSGTSIDSHGKYTPGRPGAIRLMTVELLTIPLEDTAFAVGEYTEYPVAELSNKITSIGLLRVGNYCK